MFWPVTYKTGCADPSNGLGGDVDFDGLVIAAVADKDEAGDGEYCSSYRERDPFERTSAPKCCSAICQMATVQVVSFGGEGGSQPIVEWIVGWRLIIHVILRAWSRGWRGPGAGLMWRR